MALSSSLALPSSLPLLSSSNTSFRRRISATVTIPQQQPPTESSKPLNLPIKKIPGDYGLPIIGPINDRQDYFYNQGKEDFFKSRVQKYKSTVFRVNMPPGPFISSNPNVVVLLDGKSFPTLFDVSKVEKKDLFTGTFSPSLELTGGYRVLSYLDPSEPTHELLKKLMFKLVSSTRHRVIPEFRSSFSELFDELENELATNGKAKFNDANDQASFNFLSRAWYGVNPADSELGLNGPSIISKWVLFQLGPILTLGLPKFIEESTIHTFRLPFSLIKKDYQKLYNFFYQNSTTLLQEASEVGISRDEACHNLIFTTCFNSFGGMKIFFPNMVKQIGRAGVNLHRRLAEEIRTAVRSNGGEITMSAMEEMTLMKSVVYESLRIEPPVSSQYGRAKKDMIIESHDAAFEVKKGEMLFGFQPFATKDPRIFERADEFVPDRFVGEEGEKLLKYVVWSNGPENESPTVKNKQCAGKDFVVLVSRLLLVELFLRYDSFEIDVGTSPLGAKVTVTSLKRATF
ncbi:allene oxide synthase 1, chloroplastic [Beta vulgaris subsp. vulgaris]|uniref:allene oxide synthase 1, chloroplastic n=1 Tax=Beta vulgaris subsp. vulgaris TaxID=3555 RepID=UPI002036FE8A|nr:allene oxide synthase 1, chloroplastic [Beta vulgaris subsp. vulgaris]